MDGQLPDDRPPDEIAADLRDEAKQIMLEVIVHFDAMGGHDIICDCSLCELESRIVDWLGALGVEVPPRPGQGGPTT